MRYDDLAWEIHRERCDSLEHDVPCWGPTSDDYATAREIINGELSLAEGKTE